MLRAEKAFVEHVLWGINELVGATSKWILAAEGVFSDDARTMLRMEDLRFLSSMAKLLSRFNEGDLPIIRELGGRVCFFEDVAKAKALPAGTDDQIMAALRTWSEVWCQEKQCGSSAASPCEREQSRTTFPHLNELVDQFGRMSCATMVEHFVQEAIVANDTKAATLNVMMVTDEVKGAMPPGAVVLFKEVKLFQSIRRLHEISGEGKPLGVVEPAFVLADAAKMVSSIAKNERFIAWKHSVRKDWSLAVQSMFAKLEVEFVEQFNAKYDEVAHAVQAWDFVKVPWLRSAEENAERLAEFQRLERAVVAFAIAEKSLEKLNSIDLSFAAEKDFVLKRAEKEALLKRLEKFDAHRESIKAAAKKLAMMMLANAVLVGDGKTAELNRKYIAAKLKLQDSDLPTNLLERAKPTVPAAARRRRAN